MFYALLQLVDHADDVPGVVPVRRAVGRVHRHDRGEPVHRHHVHHHQLPAGDVPAQRPGESESGPSPSHHSRLALSRRDAVLLSAVYM